MRGAFGTERHKQFDYGARLHKYAAETMLYYYIYRAHIYSILAIIYGNIRPHNNALLVDPNEPIIDSVYTCKINTHKYAYKWSMLYARPHLAPIHISRTPYNIIPISLVVVFSYCVRWRHGAATLSDEYRRFSCELVSTSPATLASGAASACYNLCAELFYASEQHGGVFSMHSRTHKPLRERQFYYFFTRYLNKLIKMCSGWDERRAMLTRENQRINKQLSN